MKTILLNLALCVFFTAPLRAEDNDGDAKPGFFHRLGKSIFRGTQKLERSDTVEPPSTPVAPPPPPAPVKKAPLPKKPVPPPVTTSKEAAPSTPAKAPEVTSKEEPAIPPQTPTYPVATPARKAGFLKSPFPPNNELDARGMISGSLARDPTTGKIFRVP